MISFDTKATTIAGFMATKFVSPLVLHVHICFLVQTSSMNCYHNNYTYLLTKDILFHMYNGSIKMLRINVLEVAVISANYITFMQGSLIS